ncbi:crustacyanin-C1 subunit-like [Penaeus japonicus]|uniref:crustacyanin-C1 subunit-like n=1 Tax=Penaeus japonicus TaxID=27405 RepID=UPI001C7167AF|nr:crustacyanin-C1 subunit-like [Penaeus japonicus]
MRGASLPYAVVVAGVVAVADGLFGIPDFLELGSCANVTLMEDFSPVKYQGLWFDVKNTPNEYQATKECISQNYTWTGDRMQVVSRGLTDDGMKVRQSMYMVPEEYEYPPNPAHMTVIMEGMPESPYQIISTDYTSYSCVYSCLEYIGFRAEFFWLFSRTPWVSSRGRETCLQELEDLGIDHTKMEDIRQGETCPYNSRLEAILEENQKMLTKIMGRRITLPTAASVSDRGANERSMGGTAEDEVTTGRVYTVNKDEEATNGTSGSDGATSASETPTATSLVCLLVLSVVLLPVVAR